MSYPFNIQSAVILGNYNDENVTNMLGKSACDRKFAGLNPTADRSPLWMPEQGL